MNNQNVSAQGLRKPTLIEQFKYNTAHTNTRTDKLGTLLVIDLDNFYAEKLDMDFLNACRDFLDRVREHFRVIHVWHRFKGRPEQGFTPENEPKGKVLPYAREEELYRALFPVTFPKAGEFILMKPHYSAFEETNLAKHILADKPVLTMGAYGKAPHDHARKKRCIGRTIEDGLNAGFQMAALPELIANRYVDHKYKGHGRISKLKTAQIASLLEESPAHEQA